MRPVALALASLLAVSPAAARSGRPRPAKVDPTSPGELTVASLNPGATLAIDGEVVGLLPLPASLRLPPGPHQVRVSLRGYMTFEAQIEVRPGEPLELEADLLPYAGLVRINATPTGASVAIDGRPAGVTPLDLDVPAGDRAFRLTHPGHEDLERVVTIEPTQRHDLEFALRPVALAPAPEGAAFYERWWFWTLVGVAGAGAATAAALSAGGSASPLVADVTVTIP
jgi:hypothetical protein